MSYQLLQGDCLEIMPTLRSGGVDAVITDPPYGIDYENGGGRGVSDWTSFTKYGWDKERPSAIYFDEMRRISKAQIIWGGNYFTDYLPPTMQWLMWDKGQRDFSLSDFEMAWSSQRRGCRVFDYSRAAALTDGKQHPTQKPVALIRWCIEQIKPKPRSVIDPFMGSGTIGVACMQMGINFTGIEVNPDYFAIAQRRIMNAAAQPPLLPVEAFTPNYENRELFGAA